MLNSSKLRDKERWFRQLFETYYAPFCLYARRFVNDSQVREDLVSEVFATVWEKLRTDTLQPESVVSYIKVAVRNQCLNHLQHTQYESLYTECKQEPIYAPAPDAVYTLEELYGLLKDTLEQMPENHRTVFVKTFLETKTQTEVAEEMQISVKSVHRYKQKAIEQLRNVLKDYLPLALLLMAHFKNRHPL